MIIESSSQLISKNPKTGEVLKTFPKTPQQDLAGIYSKAAAAQKSWSQVSLKQRIRKCRQLREIMIQKMDDIARTIHLENGKPEFEALTFELLPSVDLVTYYCGIAKNELKDKKIKIQNPFMRYRSSKIVYQPIGTVLVISPWNYPFFLAFGDLLVAVLTGNAVVFKPSEYTSAVGLKIQELFDEAGFPPGLVQTVLGDGTTGSALIDHKPAKVSFTGSVKTGKAIMKQAAEHLIPVTLELGGKDAMIVLPDADLDYATSAALWGGYTNSGQACASVERLIVHERIADEFKEQLKEKLARLAVDSDLGVCTMDRQKQIYEEHLQEARSAGADFVSGGILTQDRTRLLPTLVTGKKIEELRIYREETFGPVIAMTTFKTTEEAIRKANDSPYGLLASVITSNTALGEEIARELQVGSVMINEVMFSAGLPETPWGGLKDSGFGRKHAVDGLFEFVRPLHINQPTLSILTFKSWWWFPYTQFQGEFFKSWIRLYKNGLVAKLIELPHFLWCLAKFIKNEPRI